MSSTLVMDMNLLGATTPIHKGVVGKENEREFRISLNYHHQIV